METLADLKRKMAEGLTLDVVNHVYPSLSGERTVLKAQTKRWCLSFPEGHPKHGGTGGSWLDIPPARDLTFDGNSVTINDEGEPFVTFTFKTDAGDPA